MKFSIIIPAYNEEKSVPRAINSIFRQTINQKEYEIIVVDNNSADKTMQAAKNAGAHKVIKEPERGTNMARNRGYEESRGKIIAFLDADSIAPENWLSRIEKDFRDEKISAVSGPYDYGFKGLQKAIAFIYESKVLPMAPRILEFLFGRKAGIIIGGNFAVRKEALDKIGGIPPYAFWGDDAALAMLISRKAGKVKFDPELKVKSSPRRFKEKGFILLPLLYAKAYLKSYFKIPI